MCECSYVEQMILSDLLELEDARKSLVRFCFLSSCLSLGPFFSSPFPI